MSIEEAIEANRKRQREITRQLDQGDPKKQISDIETEIESLEREIRDLEREIDELRRTDPMSEEEAEALHDERAELIREEARFRRYLADRAEVPA